MPNIPVGPRREPQEVDCYPDECPWCFKGIDPACIAASQITSAYEHLRYIHCIFQCPRNDCRKLFIAEYMIGTNTAYLLERCYPTIYQTKTFPDAIKNVSENFVKIVNQAYAAKAYGLDQIAGPGFRKALEFLIKDFLLHRNEREPDSVKDSIRTMNLQTCIQQWVTDTRVKVCAERAAWLGNDEVHYERLWDEHSIEDLENLVRVTVNWIDSELVTEGYQKTMPAGKKR